MENNILCNGNSKTSKNSYPIFRVEQIMIKRGKDGYILVNETNQQKEVTIKNMYAPNHAPKFINTNGHKRSKKHQ